MCFQGGRGGGGQDVEKALILNDGFKRQSLCCGILEAYSYRKWLQKPEAGLVYN